MYWEETKMEKINSIDDFFQKESVDVAKNIVGMQIESKNGIYTVSATKPYHGESRQTKNKSRYQPGRIMMFNIRGHPHFCISTGRGLEQDYFLIHRVLEDQKEIKSAKGVSEALGIDFYDDARDFKDLFNLSGKTQSSTFKSYDNDAHTCLGVYELNK